MTTNDEILRRVEDKIDRLSEKISSIDVTLAAQHVSLVDHMRRTELLEQQVVPIANHVAVVGGLAKIVGILGVIIGILASIKALTGH